MRTTLSDPCASDGQSVCPESTGDAGAVASSSSPSPGAGTGRIGIQLTANKSRKNVKADSTMQAARMAAAELVRLTGGCLRSFAAIFAGKDVDKLSGPLGTIAHGSQYVGQSLVDTLQFMVLINVNLAVLNAIPLPGLDGGYAALLLLETVRGGRKLPDRVENAINNAGFLLLFALALSLFVKDTIDLTR